MLRHARFLYQPVNPLGKGGRMVTGCNAHWQISKQVAAEGTVLLKNDGTLPLQKGAKVSLFGIGAGEYLLGGGGSGNVFTDRLITLKEGLEAAAKQGKFQYFAPPADYYCKEIQGLLSEARRNNPTVAEFNAWRRKNLLTLPELPEEIYQQAKAFGGTAIFCVTRYSSEGDAGGDRTGGEGDFYLWENEKALLKRLSEDFEKVVVVLNTCGPVATDAYDIPQVGAVLYPLYGGSVSGESLAQLLIGESYPSGHLQHTLAKQVTDYPSTQGFHDHKEYVNYTEDIFVGYRYFETFAPEKVAYPFGFGLGYTDFKLAVVSAKKEKNTVSVAVSVENTGNFLGKEVVQLYLTAPQGKLGKAKKVLCAFGKTKELKPKETQILKLSFDIRQFGSFDDLGKVCKSAFLLEAGEYTVSCGNNVRDSKACFAFTLDKDIIVSRLHSYMAPRALEERLCADGSMEKLPKAEKVAHAPKGKGLKAKATEQFPLAKALAENRVEEFIASLSDADLVEFLYGHPMMNASNTNGIGLSPRYERQDVMLVPLVPTADGPAGLRLRRGRGNVDPTFFPCESLVAQTWNLPLAKRLGATVANEVKENNIGIWLAPALNIQRSPLCGRNFEYYSEDPLTSGLLAASCVQGVQSKNIAATIKHFCANNRENDRRVVDSRVSERALREIYLRGFEIAIKKAKPWALMTSYNPVNGEQASDNWEAINGILRSEWKYEGVVMTDWRVLSNLEDEVHAGSDVKMPEPITLFYENAPKSCDYVQMLREGKLNRNAVIAAVRRVITLMGKLE